MGTDLAELELFLARTPFFGGLSEDALRRLARMLVPSLFAAGATVFDEGAQGRSMYIVEAGELIASKRGDSGLRVKLVRYGRGDFFGETSLIAMQPRPDSVAAEKDSTLLELTNMDLYRLYREDVEAYVMVLQNVNRELCRRLCSADGRLTELADGSHDEVTQIRPRVTRQGTGR